MTLINTIAAKVLRLTRTNYIIITNQFTGKQYSWDETNKACVEDIQHIHLVVHCDNESFMITAALRKYDLYTCLAENQDQGIGLEVLVNCSHILPGHDGIL